MRPAIENSSVIARLPGLEIASTAMDKASSRWLKLRSLAALVWNCKKWVSNHQPIWICVGVSRLSEGDMRVDIEAVEHDPEGVKAAKAWARKDLRRR